MLRSHRRDREYRARKSVVRAVWQWDGRVVVVLEVTRRGKPLITTTNVFRVGGVGRLLAVEWLAEYLPKTTPDERYSLLWESQR